MKDQNELKEGFLRDKMLGYQVSPPDSVWKGISSGIGGRNRRRILMLTLAAAASIALAISLGINYFNADPIPEKVRKSLADLELEQSGPVREQADPVREQTEPVLEQSASVQSRQAAPDHKETVPSAQAEPEYFTEVQPAELESDFPIEPFSPAVSEILQQTAVETKDIEPVTHEEIFEVETILPADNDDFIDIEDFPSRDPRWMLGAAFSPLFSYRDAESQYIAANTESGMMSYSGGVQVGYRASRRLAVETGVFFNRTGINIGSPLVPVYNANIDFSPMEALDKSYTIYTLSNSVGNIVGHGGEVFVNNYKVNAGAGVTYQSVQSNSTSAGDVSMSLHLDYLEVPFNLRYTLLDRNFKIQVLGGVSTNLLVDNYVSLDGPGGNEEIGYLDNVKSVNYSGNAGIGMVYQFNRHLSLSMEPRFRYFLHSVNDATLPSTRPYSFGIYTGLNYFF